MHKSNYDLPYELSDELLHNPFVGICIADGKGIVLAVNEAQTRITSLPKETWVGKYMKTLVEQKLISISSTVEVLKEKRPITLHQVVSNGKSYDVSAKPIYDNHGNIKFVISYLLDITTLVQTQNTIEKLQKDKEQIEYKYQQLQEALGRLGSVVYQSPAMHDIVELAKKVANTQATVLITGPTGSGKEVIANLLHEESMRKDEPFIKVNCSAIPESLLESELFGYEPGAFTGSDKKGKKGLFESADGGTLLLDEIGEMPISLQAKLLRVLQDQQVRRIGGSKTIHVNVRLIASTNASLKAMIAQKKFREDLYYRINVIEIKVPPLSQRKEDVPLLAEHFVNIFNTKYNCNKKLSYDALQYISSMNYPGNVRELRNIIERLIVQSHSDEITLSDTFEALGIISIKTAADEISLETQIQKDMSLKEIMNQYENKVIKEYMKVYGSAAAVAKKLKTDRTTISRKITKYTVENKSETEN
ncbi:sigma 54-interacting transcriptional regulator [Anaerotignum faecicola]|nr:sigma 54-interacting transcriptional regulator [Anaerotignum faecicola]